jgi:hypothetical protein
VNPEVVFIYGSSNHAPCHAVVKRVSGPWSENRVGFCGTVPAVGPIPWVKTPQGGLCFRCKEHIEFAPDGVWRAKEAHGDPLAERLAKLLFDADPEPRGGRWAKRDEEYRLRKIAVARVALDSWPVSAPVRESCGYDDD